MSLLKAKAMAKINLTLDVTGRRDDGYHDIESVMQSVTLCDIVSLSAFDGGSDITVSCFGRSCGEENTAYMAAREFMRISGKKLSVRIEIEKQIPQAAGLGGGSADAAAVLVMLNEAYGPVGRGELYEAALNVGADVPFCISGGTALVKGIGGSVTQLEPAGEHHAVIVKSGEKHSTGRMYSMIDNMEDSSTCFTRNFLREYGSAGFLSAAKYAGNIFSRLYDGYESSAEKMRSFSPAAVSLSGAGPCIYGIFDNESAARACFEYYKGRGEKVYICKTCPHGVVLL